LLLPRATIPFSTGYLPAWESFQLWLLLGEVVSLRLIDEGDLRSIEPLWSGDHKGTESRGSSRSETIEGWSQETPDGGGETIRERSEEIPHGWETIRNIINRSLTVS